MIGPYSRDFEEVEVFNCSWVEMEGFFFFIIITILSF